MPIYKDKDRGTYYVVINHRVNGKNKATFKRGFATKREAIAWEKEALLENKYSHTSNTFRAIAEEQIQYAEISERAAEDKLRQLEIHFADLIDKPIEKITKQDLVKWRNKFKNSSLAISTKNTLIAKVKSIFHYAEKVYDISDPTKTLEKFKTTSDDVKEMQIWTPDQFNQLLPYLDNSVYQAYFTLLFWTGIRRSEGNAICKEDVDFINKTISINKSLSYHNPTKFSHLKTKGSKRVIPVDSVTLEILKPLYETADPYLFTRDTPIAAKDMGKVWKKAVDASGLPYIRIHDLRHSHASWLIANGVNIVAISKRLGHSKITQTLKTYAHLLEGTNNEMMEKIENARKV
jgi:integrase